MTTKQKLWLVIIRVFCLLLLSGMIVVAFFLTALLPRPLPQHHRSREHAALSVGQQSAQTGVVGSGTGAVPAAILPARTNRSGT